MELSEALKIFRRHVLGVFNAPTAIADSMLLFDLRVNIEDRRNSRVTDGMSANLQSGGVGSHHAIVHQ